MIEEVRVTLAGVASIPSLVLLVTFVRFQLATE